MKSRCSTIVLDIILSLPKLTWLMKSLLKPLMYGVMIHKYGSRACTCLRLASLNNQHIFQSPLYRTTLLAWTLYYHYLLILWGTILAFLLGWPVSELVSAVDNIQYLFLHMQYITVSAFFPVLFFYQCEESSSFLIGRYICFSQSVSLTLYGLKVPGRTLLNKMQVTFLNSCSLCSLVWGQ